MRVVGNVIGWSASCFYRSIKAINYITLSVKPEIGNKVNDFHFVFNGADVTGPIINRRSLHSNVLIKSGDMLALGGLILDQASKSHTKVPSTWRYSGPWLRVPKDDNEGHNAIS